MADIFISYSKTSRAQTEQLANELQAKGFTVWWDTSLIAGDNFGDVIMSELAQARAAIVIWDSASVKSEWVRSEASRARARRILIPVRAEGIRSHDIPPPFDSLHTELVSNRAGIDAALARLNVFPSVDKEDAPNVAADTAKPALALPNKPSIAVLSFTNMTGDPEQEYLSDGLAEDIITMLSRSHALFVIARNSSFTYKGRAVDVKQVGRELGVRYVLGGSVRRVGDRVRMTAQLIDAETGNHLWAERYDRNLDDIFAVQDEITEAVANAIEPAVAQMERHRAVRKLPESLSAWEAYQRGLWHLGNVSAKETELAKQFLRRAVNLDPHFASAHAWLAITLFREFMVHQTVGLPEAASAATLSAQRALSVDPTDAVAHVGMGWANFAHGHLEAMTSEARQALAASPNYADAHHLLGAALIFSGTPQQGINCIRLSMRLDPHGPMTHMRWLHTLVGLYLLRQYDDVIATATNLLRTYPDRPYVYRFLAASLGQTGRPEAAVEALKKTIALSPKAFEVSVLQRLPWMRVEDWEHIRDGLHKAGWEG